MECVCFRGTGLIAMCRSNWDKDINPLGTSCLLSHQPVGKHLLRARKVNHLSLLVSTGDGLLLLLFYNKKKKKQKGKRREGLYEGQSWESLSSIRMDDLISLCLQFKCVRVFCLMVFPLAWNRLSLLCQKKYRNHVQSNMLLLVKN